MTTTTNAAGGQVHYKFKSQKNYDTVTFDGVYISVANLKQLIAEKKGLDKEGTAELLLTNASDNQDYNDDATLVWKNASVIVRRVPKAMGKTIGDDEELKEEKKRIYVKPPDAATLNMAQQAANRNRRNMLMAKREKRERLKKMREEGENGGGENEDEEEDLEEEEEKEIKDLIANETKNWDAERMNARNAKIVAKAAGNQPLRQGIATRNNAAPVLSQGVQLAKEMQANKIMHQSYVRADGAGVPGPGYVCKRCNVPGHWIQDCPQGKDANVEVVRMKTAYGIPQNRLEGTDTGVLVGPTGESVEMKADETEFDRMMGFLTGKEEDDDDAKVLMIGDKKDGERGAEDAKNAHEVEKQQPSPSAAAAAAGAHNGGVPLPMPPPGGPPPGGPPPLPMGPPPSTAETREERDRKHAEEKAAAKERFVNMSQEEVMNMDPAEMEKLMALIGDENEDMMGGGGGMPLPGMPPPYAQQYRRGPPGGRFHPPGGAVGFHNAVIKTEPKVDMTPEEEQDADRMLRTGDFSSVEAMLKTFGCTPEQIETLMKTQPTFPNPFYGGGPGAGGGGGGHFAGPKPCYAYAKGECFRGDRCRYWHDPSIPPPDPSKQIGEGGPCWAFAQGRCFRGDACRYSHDPSVLPKDLENNPFRNAGVQDGPPPSQFGGAQFGDGGGPPQFGGGGRKRVRDNSRDRFEDGNLQREDSREGRPSSRGGYDNPPRRRDDSRDRGAPPFRFGAEQQPSSDYHQRGRRVPPGPPPGSKRTRDDSREPPGGSRPPSRDGGRPPEAKRSRRNADDDDNVQQQQQQQRQQQQQQEGGFVEGSRGGGGGGVRGGGRRAGGGGRGRAPPPPPRGGRGSRGNSIRDRLTR